jgi:hypothetical protein
MGMYINPRDMSKEEWLVKNGMLIPTPDVHRFEDDDVAVCLVDNGDFSAAGIAYSERELAAFKFPDPRLKMWFAVPISKLIEVGAIKDASSIEEI